ncbi:hypothetical protein [Zhenhengia yiwuensis]|uniref:Uncharacterized protein n=1 Tax=Zhenhengia yiwuensis TaxID=2763666 RepID=A0A926EKU9_9FIRM|nr:hypothetical protein [Zhenhengia yiwuensis]MBC8580182.1 hypothetical protein [Zhenhengia yiwuensis]MDY3369409.1 hypothetical protein [Zhenhengia yiwuensis]
MLELIEQKEANRIVEILETCPLGRNIELEIGKFKFFACNVSETVDTEHHEPYRMKEIYLLNDEDGFEVLSYNGKGYNAFLNVGEWGYSTRLRDAHITLGSTKFHDFCFQLELSQAIKDGEYIYLLKNISNMAGAGAICRLYKGLKGNKEEKLNRQQSFIEHYGKEVINYNKKDWIVISKIRRADLFEEEAESEIFYELIHSLFSAMLWVETIGA